MTGRHAYIALNMIEGLGPVRVRALIEHLGSPEAILDAPEKDLIYARGVGRELAARIVARRSAINPAEEETRAAKLGARILTPADDDYPAALRSIHDPPLALYVLGEILERDRHAVAIVGSRRCTHYGRQTADRFAFQAARLGYTVVSGLARGVDDAAHRGALKGDGRTIAVLGAALDKIYPPENTELAAAIAAGHGAIISEYSLGREPDRTTFPYRNRIISGLSTGVIVVEAPPRSGALITAETAAEQGRTVFAVPGRVDSPASRGCHALIRDGAVLARDMDDVAEELQMLLPGGDAPAKTGRRPDILLSTEEKRIVEAVAAADPIDIDSLGRKAGLPAGRISALLIGLEMRRVVRMLPGRMVELAVSLDDISPGEPPAARIENTQLPADRAEHG